MNREIINRIADAVLYEGYVLYPYRPSVKNRQRWTFGGLYPKAYCHAQQCGDASANQTECLVRGNSNATVEAVVRFLHLTLRQVGEVEPPLEEWPEQREPAFRPVASLAVDGRIFHTWQEAEEREVAVEEIALGELRTKPHRIPFAFPGGHTLEPVRAKDGKIVGLLPRERRTIEGSVELAAAEVSGGLYRITVRVENCTPLSNPGSRDDALLQALVSSHTILGVQRGEFISLADPDADCRSAAEACRNIGVWPVLVGEPGQTDTVLASPIILEDYPRIAPESPGDFFDGAEMDEMLTLRILTLTDAEKCEMAAVDPRTAALLARGEEATRGELLGLHGTIRELRPIHGEGWHG